MFLFQKPVPAPSQAASSASLCNLKARRHAKCCTICGHLYPSYKEFMQFSRFLMVFAICKENSVEFEESGKNLEKEESCLLIGQL